MSHLEQVVQLAMIGGDYVAKVSTIAVGVALGQWLWARWQHRIQSRRWR